MTLSGYSYSASAFLPVVQNIETITDLTPLQVSPNTSLSQGIKLMVETREQGTKYRFRSSCLFVVANDQLLGLITERDIVRLSLIYDDFDQILVKDIMTPNPRSLYKSEIDDTSKILHLFQEHQIRHLPLLDQNNKLLGVITPETLRSGLQASHILRLRSVQELMTQYLLCVTPSIAVQEILEVMVQEQVSCVIVVETANKVSLKQRLNCQQIHSLKPVGIITERDLVELNTLFQGWRELTAETIMTSPLKTMNIQDTLWQVQDHLNKHKIRRAVITGNKGELRGLITQTDLLKLFDPLEVYSVIDLLSREIQRLEQEKVNFLKQQNYVLESEVQIRVKELQQQLERDRVYEEIAQKIRESLDLEQILNCAVFAIRQLLNCDRVIVYQIFDFLPEGSWGKVLAEAVTFPASCLLHQRFYSRCDFSRRLAINNIYEYHSNKEQLEQLKKGQIKAYVNVPIWINGQLWGVIMAHHCNNFCHWESHHLQLLDQLSLQLGIAIKQSELYQQAHNEIKERLVAEKALAKREQYLSALVEIQQLLLVSSDDPQVEKQILEILCQTFIMDQAYFFKHQNQSLQYKIIAQYPSISPESEEVFNLYSDSFHEWLDLLSQGEVMISNNTSLTEDLKMQGICSLIILPVATQSQHFGWISLEDHHLDRVWEKSELDLLRAVTTALSVSLQQREAEVNLRRSEDRYSRLSEVAPVGIFQTDLEGNYLYVNDVYVQLTGLNTLQLIPKGWTTVLHPNDQETVISVWEKAINNQESFCLEYRFLHPNKKVVWVFGQAIVERDDQGNCIGYVGTITDISDRKKAEASLKQLNEELELRVEQRTVELIQEIKERKQAEAKIRASLKEKELLLKEIHHRVKNNLQIISSLLSFQGENNPNSGILSLIHDSQNRIYSMALIHEKLYRSDDLAMVDLETYLMDLVTYLFQSYQISSDRVIPIFEVKSISLSIDTAISCGLIINELVSNICKHAFPDGREGIVKLTLSQNEAKEITIIIADNGVGFPHHINFRDTESLGLQLVCTLTQQLEGNITLNNQFGTTFTLTFSEPHYQKRL